MFVRVRVLLSAAPTVDIILCMVAWTASTIGFRVNIIRTGIPQNNTASYTSLCSTDDNHTAVSSATVHRVASMTAVQIMYCLTSPEASDNLWVKDCQSFGAQ